MLKLASEEIREDKKIVLEAVKQNPDALRFASPELQIDPEILAHDQNSDAANMKRLVQNYLRRSPCDFPEDCAERFEQMKEFIAQAIEEKKIQEQSPGSNISALQQESSASRITTPRPQSPKRQSEASSSCERSR